MHETGNGSRGCWGAARLLGLFADGSLTPEKERTEKSTEPRLPDMTRAALRILEKDEDGFFLMVEGSQIDRANHMNDARYQLMPSSHQKENNDCYLLIYYRSMIILS